MDVAVSREWARLKHRQSDSLFENAMTAATARVHRLTVVTRNVRDFHKFEVELFGPFKGARRDQKTWFTGGSVAGATDRGEGDGTRTAGEGARRSGG